jgi:hypothetical protein
MAVSFSLKAVWPNAAAARNTPVEPRSRDARIRNLVSAARRLAWVFGRARRRLQGPCTGAAPPRSRRDRRRDGHALLDHEGLAWVDPFREEAGDYILVIAWEAAALGFDDIHPDSGVADAVAAQVGGLRCRRSEMVSGLPSTIAVARSYPGSLGP